jgi:hypothetical protein
MAHKTEHRFQFIPVSSAHLRASQENGAAVAGDPSTQPTLMSYDLKTINNRR